MQLEESGKQNSVVFDRLDNILLGIILGGN